LALDAEYRNWSFHAVTCSRKTCHVTRMTKNLVSFTLAVLLPIASISAQTAKQDTKEAGQDVKDAGKVHSRRRKESWQCDEEDQQRRSPTHRRKMLNRAQ